MPPEPRLQFARGRRPGEPRPPLARQPVEVTTMAEIYVSTDVETDGPIPGAYSMLSFASAAYRADKSLLQTFSANLETLPEATQHPETMAWWQTQPEAWAACRQDAEPPAVALPNPCRWGR